jgi:two-component system cell cycle sensor histidine kinase/response regulator CckA
MGPAGVFEVYEPYAPVAAAVRGFVAPFAALLLLSLLALWVALFPLVQRMVRAVARDREARHSAEQALEETAEQLRQSQKMEAIGRLAGGVAHDFNNLLLAINGYSEFLADSLVGERERRFAREIRAAGERAAALTAQLLAFSRRQVLQPQVMNLNDAVAEIESILRRLIGESVEVVFELDSGLPPVEADPTQIGQVLLNLAVNARDAMAGVGTLTIRTRGEADTAALEVSDTGTGMDDETRARIFEPFFTTKLPGHGTGLGLSTVYGIVTQTGGTIAVDSAPGRGATFSLRLPATQLAPGEQDTAVTVLPSGGVERVLVVDDEQVVRELVAQMLRGRGYRVWTAGSAEEATTLDGHWDLLITDVVMPGVNGVDLARQIDATHVLFMSGYDQHGVLGEAAFLQKPFGRDRLVRAVRELLDAGAVTSAAV